VESTDPVLSLLGAMGLGQAVGTALVVDMCRDLNLRIARSLADIVAEGPTLAELSPGRSGVALLSSGPLSPAECLAAVGALAPHWPAVVVRCEQGKWDGPTVPVRPLLPGLLQWTAPGPAVWQPLAGSVRPPGPGPVLPRLRASSVRRMLSGRALPRSRWVHAWGPVWGMPWA
jgi:hypothetical protein